MKTRKIIYVFLFFICISKINAQNTNELLSFMIYGSDHLISISLPNTWNVNMQYAQQNGLNGFFFLRNYNFNNSPAIIILSLEYNQNKIFENWIENSINNFLNYYKGFSSERLNWTINNQYGYNINVYKFKHNTRNLVQYCSYLDVGLNYFVQLYITIIDQSKHDEMLEDFKRCLENSRFTGIGVNTIE